ncbi:MAG: phosphoethanolamine transferase domain-containing protein, partial [Muribaculum sp.]|nr:phosphoethanolamine transferase domain-containing protein [Muribaculum sp.]
MKLSDWKQTDTTGYRPAILWLWTLILLTAPNVGLEMTDTLLPAGYGGTIARLGFTFMPLGCYILLLTCIPRIGKAFWISFPLIFLSAFQIVLLNLFGSQPIAVDMWLNLVTTNVSEASELLGSMLTSIVVITIGYIPAIIMAIIATRRHWTLPIIPLRKTRSNGILITLTGLILTVTACIISPSISLLKSLYPVNVVYNACLAADRTAKVARYHTTSAGDTYRATSLRPDSLPEIYVIVVGETARADHFQIYGYQRPTTPLLARHSGQHLVHFPNTLSESNTTHKSVPMLLSYLDARTFEDSIYTSKGVFTAMREAGFTTVFISNQGRNGSFIDFFGEEADSVTFIRDTYNGPAAAPHDTDIL